VASFDLLGFARMRASRLTGRVREVVLKTGYAFVEFDDRRDADDAVYELNGKDLLGERIVIEHARGPSSMRGGGGDRYDDRKPFYASKYGPPTRTDYRVIVKNLSSRVSWQDLKDYMRQAGEVTFADAHRDRPNEGEVCFSSYDDMRNAIRKLDDTEINGRAIRVEEFGGGGRRRSRSRSRSRRRSRSRSARRSRSGSRKRSRSRSAKRSRSRSAKKSRSPKKSRSRSPKKSRSRSPKKSRSRSPSAKKGRSHSPNGETENNKKSQSKSRSKSPKRSKSRSRSKSPKRSKSRSRSKSNPPRDSKSRSKTPERRSGSRD